MGFLRHKTTSFIKKQPTFCPLSLFFYNPAHLINLTINPAAIIF